MSLLCGIKGGTALTSTALATRPLWLTMPCDLSGNLTPARRVADMDGILQIEVLHHRGSVRSVMVHVVAVPDLGGPSVPPPVMGNE